MKCFTKSLYVLMFFSYMTLTHADDYDACMATQPPLQPLLSEPDFNADGTVNSQDLRMLVHMARKGEYVALYDVNADESLDHHDIQAAAKRKGQQSSVRDRDIVAIYEATKQYQSLSAAVLDSYLVVTENFKYHGTHWLHPDRWLYTDENRLGNLAAPPVMTAPAGLNYSSDGKLQALFWGDIIDVNTLDPVNPVIDPHGAPKGVFSFSPEPHWHSHQGACVANVGYLRQVEYAENYKTPEACEQRLATWATDQGFPDTFGPSAKNRSSWVNFYMLHLWLYKLNPAGAFTMEHPCVSLDGKDPSGFDHSGH